jgi:DNA-binding protein WhiA
MKGGVNMSFSSDTKDELARIIDPHDGCALAELTAVLCVSGTVSLLGEGRVGLYVQTEHAPTARRLLQSIRRQFGVKPELRAVRRGRLGGRNTYRLSLTGAPAEAMLLACGVLHRDTEGRFFIRPVTPRKALARKCCRRAFLRGAFLACGSVSNPEKEYHSEFVAGDPRFAATLRAVLSKFGLAAKTVRRKGAVVVYLKEAEQIVTLLNLIGAHGALLALEDIRIRKELRNNVNRVVNCDSANLGKTVDAATRQMEAIERILALGALDRLPLPLRQMAETRMQHREASLQELGALLDPPVGKSGVNHRLRRLIAYADALKTNEEGAP